jgi:D-arabinose 1-dehydrogenase-like Zn-dependent alcohol dehydrogenase
MIRTLLSLAAGIGVGVAVTFAADHDHHNAVKARPGDLVAVLGLGGLGHLSGGRHRT